MVIAFLCRFPLIVTPDGSSKHFPGDRPREQSRGLIFYIATRRSPNRVQIVPDDSGNIFEKTDLDLKKKTIFIIHGIRSSANAEWVKDLQNALLNWVR